MRFHYNHGLEHDSMKRIANAAGVSKKADLLGLPPTEDEGELLERAFLEAMQASNDVLMQYPGDIRRLVLKRMGEDLDAPPAALECLIDAPVASKKD